MRYVAELKDNGSSLWGVTAHLCAKLPGTRTPVIMPPTKVRNSSP